MIKVEYLVGAFAGLFIAAIFLTIRKWLEPQVDKTGLFIYSLRLVEKMVKIPEIMEFLIMAGIDGETYNAFLVMCDKAWVEFLKRRDK